MNKKLTAAIYVAILASFALSQNAAAQPSASFVIWRQTTELNVVRATDWDGTDDTADARGRNWDNRGSGLGIRVGYNFPRLVSLYGLLGLAQVTVRDEDLADPMLDLDSRGFDDDVYFAAGVRISDDFPNNERVFWSASLAFSFFSSDVEQDIARSWNYDETMGWLKGTAGYKVHGVGLYGGLRLVWYDGELIEADITNTPGQQTRIIEFERDNDFDLLIGARTIGVPVGGFVELNAVGSFGAVAGFSFTF